MPTLSAGEPARMQASTMRGFTLLELMVVMVIAGLMITLVPPLFSTAVPGTRLKGSARDLAIVLRESRSTAIINNSEQLVQLDLKHARYQDNKGKTRSLPANVAISVELITGSNIDPGAQHVVRFFPDGSCSGELITLSGGNDNYYLQLNWLTGSVTITSGSGNAG